MQPSLRRRPKRRLQQVTPPTMLFPPRRPRIIWRATRYCSLCKLCCRLSSGRGLPTLGSTSPDTSEVVTTRQISVHQGLSHLQCQRQHQHQHQHLCLNRQQQSQRLCSLLTKKQMIVCQLHHLLRTLFPPPRLQSHLPSNRLLLSRQQQSSQRRRIPSLLWQSSPLRQLTREHLKPSSRRCRRRFQQASLLLQKQMWRSHPASKWLRESQLQ
mmetsp:Transcript_6814/g.14894  ORF Transcript_6814/g.14894 Transcript_6814/m.14894 type:complete len:212 (-) Transcript_6814:1632-2267(-)